MKTLPLLAILLALGGCVSITHQGSGTSGLAAQSAPGQILYGADTVVECKYNSGCRTVRQ